MDEDGVLHDMVWPIMNHLLTAQCMRAATAATSALLVELKGLSF